MGIKSNVERILQMIQKTVTLKSFHKYELNQHVSLRNGQVYLTQIQYFTS